MRDPGTGEESTAEFHEAVEAYRRRPSLPHARRLQTLARSPGPDALGLSRARVAVLRTFTIENLLPYLEAALLAERVSPEFHLGGYGQLEQEILEAEGALASARPDVVILAWSLRDLAASLFWDASRRPPRWPWEECGRVLERAASLVSALRSRTDATVVLFNFELPAWLPGGQADVSNGENLVHAVHDLNRRLLDVANKHRSVFVLDYERLVARHGSLNWSDPKLWYFSRNPVAGRNLPHLASELARVLRAAFGRSRKVLVLDCDGTLWGGIVGEEGMAKIAVGDDFPGNAYKEFQRAILTLHDRGVILAVNSKNNPEDVAQVFEHHSEMILKREHIASWRVNWQGKPENMVEIAGELNVGLDSLVFMDDSPVERELMRQALPSVLVVDLPESPVLYTQVLLELGVFDTLTLTDEDRRRGGLYRAQAERRELERRSLSMEDFLRSLEMEAEVGEIAESDVGRVAQLTQKTNQFNLTVRRYTEQEIDGMRCSPAARVYFLRLSDRFGDLGLVGVAVVRVEPDRWIVENFLESCRVIGRGAERALLSRICADARGTGVRVVVGRFVQADKNHQTRNFYADHGFERMEGDEKASDWLLNLGRSSVAWPPWIAGPAANREGG